MTLEESRKVIPVMETMINQIEEQQKLMAKMVQELQERDRQQEKSRRRSRGMEIQVQKSRTGKTLCTDASKDRRGSC